MQMRLCEHLLKAAQFARRQIDVVDDQQIRRLDRRRIRAQLAGLAVQGAQPIGNAALFELRADVRRAFRAGRNQEDVDHFKSPLTCKVLLPEPVSVTTARADADREHIGWRSRRGE
jgi:hypothetical protein